MRWFTGGFLLILASSGLAQVSNLSWTSVGPVNFTDASGSHESGKILALGVSGDQTVMYAGAGSPRGLYGNPTSTGVWKTTDGGKTWNAVNNGLTDHAVSALWVDPANSDHVLAGTDGVGIFQTRDGGQNWQVVTTAGTPSNPDKNIPAVPGTNGSVADFAVFNANILAAGQGGLLRSTDNGNTWSVFVPLSVATNSTNTVASAGGVVAVGFYSGNVIVRPNENASFGLGIASTGGSALSLAIDPVTPSTIYHVDGPTSAAVWVSTDTGITWTKLTGAPSGPQCVAVGPAGGTVYLGTSNGLYSSNDNGQTWTAAPAGKWSIRRVYIPDGSTVIAVGEQGIHKTNDGGKTWQDLSATLPVSLTDSVSTHGFSFHVTDHQFFPMVSPDGGITWSGAPSTGQNTLNGQGGQTLINSGDSTYRYFMTGSGFSYSNDRGKTYKSSGTAGLKSQGSNVAPQNTGPSLIAVDPTAPANVYVAAVSDFFVSTDWGVTMTASGWGLQNPTAIAVSPASGKIILAGTKSGLNLSADGGKSWSQSNLAGAGGYPVSIAFNPKDPNVVLAVLSKDQGNGGGVYRSSDGGITFSAFNNGLPSVGSNPQNTNVNLVSVRFSAGGAAALASSYGVFLSADGQSAWNNISADATSGLFKDVWWDGSYLYAATYGAGVLRSQPFGPPTATLSADPTPITFSAIAGSSSSPSPVKIAVSSSADPLPFSASGTTASGGSWLLVSPGDATSSTSIQITVSATGLAAGIYTGTVLIGSTSAANTISIPVTLTVNPSLATVTGVYNAASFDTKFAGNSWVAIQGTNLAATTRSWTAADFQGNNLPTQLDGVSVTINNKPAYIYYVSPTQVNVLSPESTQTSSVPVVLAGPLGTAPAFTGSLTPVAPGFFLFGKYIVATHLDGTLVAPVGYVAGVSSTPAKSGETIILYGTGFGPTSPQVSASTINPPTPLQLSTNIHFGGVNNISGVVSYSGIVSPGLAQFNVTIPQKQPDGDVDVVAEAGGHTTGDHYIAIKN